MQAKGISIRLFSLFVLLSVPNSSLLLAERLPSREEVLRLVYPTAVLQAERVFLTKQQLSDAAALAETEIPSALLARYILKQEGLSVGRAYVDTHVIRAKKESLLVCLDSSGQVKRIEVTAFHEPPEYRAPDGWFEQFRGMQLEDDLRVNRGIRPLTGATLTANAVSTALRRVLAIDKVLGK